MAKGKNDSGGNDYLEQLQWQAQHHPRRWTSVRFQPKWKYKIAYRFPQTTPFGKILQVITLLGSAFLIYQLISSAVRNESSGAKVFYAVVLGMIILIVLFAIRDGSKDSDHKSDS